jgi:hypothetical protein
LQPVYAEVAAKAGELQQQGLTHAQVCNELNRLGFRTRTGKPWRHPQQVIKLLRSFGKSGLLRRPAGSASIPAQEDAKKAPPPAASCRPAGPVVGYSPRLESDLAAAFRFQVREVRTTASNPRRYIGNCFKSEIKSPAQVASSLQTSSSASKDKSAEPDYPSSRPVAFAAPNPG